MGMPETGGAFIFMNHANAEGDVRVIVHEAGHAIHSFLEYDIELFKQRNIPMEVAELASMSMELFTMENWEIFYNDNEDLNRAKKNHLSGLLRTLCGVAKGDEFQHWIYENPTHTTQERHKKWMELSKKFGSGMVDYSGIENYLESSYQGILHFYQVPFYYIEYGFAQLGAIALWKNYKANANKTIHEYKNALALGYTKTIPQIYETAGITFDFSKENVSKLGAFVQEEISEL
ncbi:MAG: M3 family metallopeptidase [Chitinophagales bacterium]|nr:M3 family metallopeptidase [Chitinophagales bacterium]